MILKYEMEKLKSDKLKILMGGNIKEWKFPIHINLKM